MDAHVNPHEYLEMVGDLPDQEVDVAPVSIAMASLLNEGRKPESYFRQLKKISGDVAARYDELLEAGAEDLAETRLAALKHILADKFGFLGNENDSDHYLGADMMSVIDRSQGLPVSLTILYIHAARAQGWEIEALLLPSYCLPRLQNGPQRLIFDPFRRGEILAASDIRGIVKAALGDSAELSASYFEPVSNRDILINQYNFIKSHQIEISDYEGALQTIEVMRLVAPGEFRLLLDAGVLYSRTGQNEKAIPALETYIERAPDHNDRYDAELLLEHILSEQG